MTPDRLSTERLALSPPEAGDAAAVFAVAGDPRTVAHNPSDMLMNEQAADELLTRWIQHWDEHGFGYWCVRLHRSDQLIGYSGIKRMTSRGQPVLNLIYRFTPEVWGNGYATEAGTAVVDWASQQLPAETLLARVRPENHPSRNVALKLGLRRDPELDENGEDGPDLAFSNRLRSGCADGIFG